MLQPALIQTRDPNGRGPLFHVIFGHALDSASLLLAAGADVHFRDRAGLDLAEIAWLDHRHRLQHSLSPPSARPNASRSQVNERRAGFRCAGPSF